MTAAKSKAGYVYLIHAIGTSRYKIGETRRAFEDRMRELRGQSPYPLQCVNLISVPDSKASESILHKRFAEHRLVFEGSNEWFEFSSEFVERVVIPTYQAVESRRPQRKPVAAPVRQADNSHPLDFLLFGWGGKAIAVAAVALIAAALHSNPATQHYKAAYQQISREADSGSDNYHNAAVNFHRAAKASTSECSDRYLLGLEQAAKQTEGYLMQTGNHDAAWQLFLDFERANWSIVLTTNCQDAIEMEKQAFPRR